MARHRFEPSAAVAPWPNALGRSATTPSAMRSGASRPEPIFALGCDIARRLKRNGILRSDWSRGLVVAAVDGIEICSSLARCCDACMEGEVQHKVRGEMRTDIQYYHRIVAAVIVSTPVPIPLGIRFQKDGEAERFSTGPPASVQSDPKQELRCWHLPQVDWPVADRLVRVVTTVRIEHKRQVTVSQDGDHLTKGKADVALESTNSYATNFDLGAIPPTCPRPL